MSTIWDWINWADRPRSGVRLGDVEAFDVSDIVAFHAANTDDSTDWRALPNIAPPFRSFFMFARSPRLWRAGGSIFKEATRGQVGALFTAARGDSGWSVSAQGIGGNEHRHAWFPYVIQWDVNKEGRLAWKEAGSFALGTFKPLEPLTLYGQPATGEQLIDFMTVWMYPFALATTLLHCKNVSARRVEVPAKLRSAQAKRGRPSFSYSVLDITPMKRTLQDEGGIGRGGSIQKALHICRGHFKDYRDGAGLFGRYKGLFWWEQALRGSAETGEHAKDYRVKSEDSNG